MFTKLDSLLWTDSKYKTLSDDSRLLFIYVFSCNHRNVLGYYFLPIPYAAFDLGWSSERVSKGLEELSQKGFITYNYETNMILVINFLKYNPLENPNQIKGAMKTLGTLPTDTIDIEFIEVLEGLGDLLSPLIDEVYKQFGKGSERVSKGYGKQEEEEEEVEVEVEVIETTPYQDKYINILRNIKDYPLDLEKDIEYMDIMKERYPTLDLVQAIEKFSSYIFDNPFNKNANHRSQINTSFKKYVEWGQCIKPSTEIKKQYVDDNPFNQRVSS